MRAAKPYVSEQTRKETPVCQFCKTPLEVRETVPDHYGGHFVTKRCECPGVIEAQKASQLFRVKLGGR